MIENCPFCDGTDTFMNNSTTMEEREEPQYFITCNKCWAEGPKSYSENEATEMWNKAHRIALPKASRRTKPFIGRRPN